MTMLFGSLTVAWPCCGFEGLFAPTWVLFFVLRFAMAVLVSKCVANGSCQETVDQSTITKEKLFCDLLLDLP